MVLTSDLHSLPLCKTANYHQPRTEKNGEKESERASKPHSPFSPSLSSHPPSLSSSLSLPPFSGGSRSPLARTVSLRRDLATSWLFLSPFSIFSTLCHELDRLTQGRLCFLPLGMAVRFLGLCRGGSAEEKERVIEKEPQEGRERGPPSAAGRARCSAAPSCAQDGPEPALRPRLLQRLRPPRARRFGQSLKS